ncbi:hypothetical protein BU25DRAFT_454635 [Macroventuria anomochaeta]|uniref:Uncharacterized protein n=1 Tax=Macroventuria anomochaeta TaxID=301207 RepID=A0ACB6SE59_9PLEO|nr:uncharacterized protein BU25DRAFT_454635 [Macroventuria anomochaeta]KAF2632283.1 hypothetical protein BU25DRAFT_454635 [Macroventuria anomochaeta]
MMDGLPRDKINMAKNLTSMIKSQLRAIHNSALCPKFDAFDVIHYKCEAQFAAVAVGYVKDLGGYETLLRGRGRENVIEALEALWSHTQKQLTEKFKKEPLEF